MIASVLDLEKLLLDLFDDLNSAELVLLHLVRHVRNYESDDDFESNDKVLHADGKQEDIGTIPVVGVPLLEVLHQGGFLFELDCVQILVPADGHRREATDQEDERVARDGEVRDETHDGHPVADSVSILRNVSFSEPCEVLQLDLDLKSVGEKGEQGCERESSSKEGHEAHLNEGFIVEGHERVSCRLHLLLLFDLAVHLQVSLLYYVSRQASLLNRLLEKSINFLQFAVDLNLILQVLHDVQKNLFGDHDSEDTH